MKMMRFYWMISLIGLAALSCLITPASSQPTATAPEGYLLFMRENGSGGQDIWIAQGDGKNELSLVSGVSDGRISNAYLTPDGKRIVFTLHADGSDYFWVSDIQGQESKMVISGDQVYYLPSKNGSHILVQSNESDNQTLQLITPDGQDSTTIYEDTDEYWHYFDLPENAGSSFAYARLPFNLEGGESTLNILQLDTGENVQIASAFESYLFPAYQSGNESLLYILLDPEERNNGEYETIWRLESSDLAGNKQDRIGEGVLQGDIQSVRWAYDGSSLLLLTYVGFADGYYLYRIDANGSITTLALQEDYIFLEDFVATEFDRYWAYLTWDADTEEYTLYLAKEGEEPRPVITDQGVWFMNISKDGLRVTYIIQKDIEGDLAVYIANLDDLTAIEVGKGEYSAGSLFTSDGEYLLVGEWDSEDSLSLRSTNGDGSQPNLIFDSFSDLYGRFSPDEEWLVFGGKLAGDIGGVERWSQFLYCFSTGENVTLTNAAPYPTRFDYSPDGRYIVYDVYSDIEPMNPRAIYRAAMDGSQAVLLILNAYSPTWASNRPAGIWTAEGTISSPGGLFGGLGGP